MTILKKAFLIMIGLLFTSILSAQVSINVNIGTPSARYYYLQDIEVYYDIQTSMYIYPFGGRWVRSRTLPASYGNYDLNNSHRVIINDYHGKRPYGYFNEHREKFPKGHYNTPENNYWSAKEHEKQVKPNKEQGKKPKEENRNNNNRNNGNGKGRDKRN